MKKFITNVKNAFANQAGMTLLELLVVVVILGILAGISFQAFSGQGEDARVKAHQTNLESLQNAAERYDLEVGFVDSEFGAVDNTHVLITEGYLKEEVKNPWEGTNQPFAAYSYSITKDVRGIFYAYLEDGVAGYTSDFVTIDADGNAVVASPGVGQEVNWVAPGAEANSEDRVTN